MLKIIVLAVAIMFVVVCALFNFRVSWANIKSRHYHDRRLVYFITAELATVAAGFVAWKTSGSWLTETAMNCEAAGYNGGLAYLFLLVMGVTAVVIVGASVYCLGSEGEDFWAKRFMIAKH